MSRTRPSTWERAEIAERCAYCGAEPGHWCQTVSGRWADLCHWTRWRDAWSKRLGDDLADAVAAVNADP